MDNTTSASAEGTRIPSTGKTPCDPGAGSQATAKPTFAEELHARPAEGGWPGAGQVQKVTAYDEAERDSQR